MKYFSGFQFNKLLLIFFLLFSLNKISKAQEQYVVQGDITGLTKDTKIYFSYIVERDLIRDSAMTINGNFTFTGKVPRPLKASLQLQSNERSNNNVDFYLSGGTTIIKGKDLVSATVKGGQTQDDYMNLTHQLKFAKDSLNALISEVRPATHQDSISFFKQKNSIQNKVSDEVKSQFILANSSSYVAYDLLRNKAIAITEPDKFITLFNAMNPAFQNTAEGKAIKKRMILAKKFDIGQPAIDFMQNDPQGKPVSLSSFKGKYVLIDFWASWCGPCRIEYPFLKKAYRQFKDKNFEIIGISLDDKKSQWIESIKTNGFEWTELCDLKGKQNAVAQTYGIAAIPQSFLVSPEGIIIAKNLRGEDLIKKLAEIIK